MSTDIQTANDARQVVVSRYGPILSSCTVVLSDSGFGLEVLLKQGYTMPQDFPLKDGKIYGVPAQVLVRK